tara:strand:- start:2086 stop:2403 length:318 start_codon:yes stop_codon:yes gene_type:complete
MSIENTITNTKTVADSFVNDQLIWRRERIETLTREIKDLKEQNNQLRQLFTNEVDFVKLMKGCIEDLLQIEGANELDSAKKAMEQIDRHIYSQEQYIIRNFLNKK